MLGVLTITVAIGLTAILFITRQVFLGFAAGGAWMIFGAYCYQQSEATWDIYYALGWFSMLGLMLVCILGAFAMRREDRSAIEKAGEMEEPAEVGEEEELDEFGGKKIPSRSDKIRARADKRRNRFKVRKKLEGRR